MAESGTPGANAGQIDTDQDRYPELIDVVNTVLEDPNVGGGPVERVEITCLASGEATYRIWPARAEEPELGYMFPAQGF